MKTCSSRRPLKKVVRTSMWWMVQRLAVASAIAVRMVPHFMTEAKVLEKSMPLRYSKPRATSRAFFWRVGLFEWASA